MLMTPRIKAKLVEQLAAELEALAHSESFNGIILNGRDRTASRKIATKAVDFFLKKYQ